ncbi:Lar family restriction alleviation protein [Herbaspirillum huttiense]|uniref:Lar family restriction alleviation protein n=1 Tax=Herbaspirillum huttiense TaxID=863372 RepID=UPI002E77B12D|nr:Lar family restriction alleviation protein [Herbaspirillum huttiense]MEE1636397.1 Lar family restriction alleviation protein [Herbaspirillum huttiense NC40101]
MSDELKPCPFCGSTDVRNVSGTSPGPSYRLHARDTIFAVNCGSCGASVPNRYRNELVIESWNRRAQPAEEVQRVGKVIGASDGAVLGNVAHLDMDIPVGTEIFITQIAAAMAKDTP